jgi:hypothetical protein
LVSIRHANAFIGGRETVSSGNVLKKSTKKPCEDILLAIYALISKRTGFLALQHSNGTIHNQISSQVLAHLSAPVGKLKANE